MTNGERMFIFVRDFFTCQCCGKVKKLNGLQIAHRIKKGSGTEKYLKKYLKKNHPEFTGELKDIINHPANLRTACSLACNDSFNIFFDEVERDKLVDSIVKSLSV